MFNTSKIIIIITKTKIKAFSIKLGASPIIERQEEFDWKTETLVEVLNIIKSKFGPSIRILLSDEFVYITTIQTDIQNIATRASILQAAQQFIPEDMSQTSWDYRTYPTYIQVEVLNKSIYDQITEAVKKADIEIEAMESYSNSLARLLAEEKEPFVLAYQDDVPLISTIHNGVALTTSVIKEILTAEVVEKAVHFSQEQFKLSIKKIIKTENIGDIFASEFFKDFVIETKKVEPAIGMALKTDIRIPDSKSLNLEIDPAVTKKVHHRSYRPYIIFITAFFITVATVIFGQNYFVKEEPVQSAARPVIISPTVAPTATPSAFIEQPITIKILNNSGLPGEDEHLTDILLANNYTNITSDDTTQKVSGVRVIYSARVDDSYLKELDKVLKTIYTTVNTEPNLAPDEADVTIIIGTLNPK